MEYLFICLFDSSSTGINKPITFGVTKLPTDRNALRALLCFIKREFDKLLIYITDLY